MGNELTFEIEETGRIAIPTFASWESRGQCAIEILTLLAEQWPGLFRGRSGIICYGDSPPAGDWTRGHDLAFCSTKRLGRMTGLPFPCPMILRWPEVGIPDAVGMMRHLLIDDSPAIDDRIFWIGAESHPSRRALFEIGRKHRDLLDVEIIEWDRNARGGQRTKTRQVPIPEHRRYKYLIDCPGNGYSSRIKWLLATGRPVFIVEREVVEHRHEDLVPWRHFIPVAHDLSDLLANHHRLESDPELSDAIGQNGRRFAAEHLTFESRIDHTARAVMTARAGIAEV